MAQNGLPEKVVIDGSASNHAAINTINVQLWLSGLLMLCLIDIISMKYLNNIIEQSHRWVKQKTRQALTWKSMEGEWPVFMARICGQCSNVNKLILKALQQVNDFMYSQPNYI